MAPWTWVLADAAGAALTELDTAAGRSLTFVRNDFAEATGTLSLDDADAATLMAVLETGLPQLRCYRDRALRFSGELASLDDSADADSSSMTFAFRDPFANLYDRFTAALRAFAATDAGLIGSGLLADANAESATGLILGSVATTKTRDRTYVNQNVGEAITALTTVLDGFDFYVTPLDPTDPANPGALGALYIVARQGVDRPEVVFGYGPTTVANVAGVRRQIQLPVNKVRTTGAAGGFSDKTDDTSIAAYRLRMRVVSQLDVSDSTTLADKSAAALRPRPIRVVSFDPDPKKAPQPWVDYWLGDTPRFYAKRGALNENLSPRINGIGVDIDETGRESSHTLSIEGAVT